MKSFETNPKLLTDILNDAAKGILQLPDFQRGWVWSENGIKELIISILKGFPIGALMTLEVGGEVKFEPRPIEGVLLPAKINPTELILDGQQRTTSLFLSMFNDSAVGTTDDKNKKVKSFYYIDIQKAVSGDYDISESVVIAHENKKVNDQIVLSTRDKEFEKLFFPFKYVFQMGNMA
jgi:uncharacterized protein with ParB-like and HNH nuclease domain